MKRLFAPLALALLALPLDAHAASITWNLDCVISGAGASSCGAFNYGTITVIDQVPDPPSQVTFVVNLTSGDKVGEVDLNVVGDDTAGITLFSSSAPPTTFINSPNSVPADGYPIDFDLGVNPSVAGATNLPLSFTLDRAGLTIGAFNAPDVNGILAGVHIQACLADIPGCAPGDSIWVGARVQNGGGGGNGGGAPEPATVGLMALGLAAVLRRRLQG